MATSSQIVVGTDGSAEAEFAIRWAAAEARSHGACLVVVHAWVLPSSEIAAKQVLEDSITRALGSRRHGGLSIEPVTVHGTAARVLCELAARAELLVVGSRGHSSLGGRLVGSVSMYCLRHADCPVAVVPPLAQLRRPTQLVCGVDGSDASRKALAWAVAAARRRHARLAVVHAWQVPQPVGTWAVAAPVWSPYEYKVIGQHVLDRELAVIDTADVEVVPRLVEGSPRHILLDVARGEDADLIVVGSRGAGAIEGLLLGSVSERCAEHGEFPVVVVR